MQFFFDFFERRDMHIWSVKLFVNLCISSLNGVDKNAKFNIKLLNWLIEPVEIYDTFWFF